MRRGCASRQDKATRRPPARHDDHQPVGRIEHAGIISIGTVSQPVRQREAGRAPDQPHASLKNRIRPNVASTWSRWSVHRDASAADILQRNAEQERGANASQRAEHEAAVQPRRSPRNRPHHVERAVRQMDEVMMPTPASGRPPAGTAEPIAGRSQLFDGRDTCTLHIRLKQNSGQRACAAAFTACVLPRSALAGPGRAKLALRGRLRRRGLWRAPHPALRHSEARFRLLFNSGRRRRLCLCPQAGEVTEANRRAKRAPLHFIHRALVRKVSWSGP